MNGIAKPALDDVRAEFGAFDRFLRQRLIAQMAQLRHGRLQLRDALGTVELGEPADRDRLAIRFGNTQVARDGLPVEDYDETPVAAHLKGSEISIGVGLGLGTGRATVWTCDLTHGYISINADYRS